MNEWIMWIAFILAFLTAALLFLYIREKKKLSDLFLMYYELKSKIPTEVKQLFEDWKSSELAREAGVLFEKWKLEEEKSIREDAVRRSQSVITGKVAEHFIPFLPEFKYNPKNARFLGTPIDFVVFEGLHDGNISKIVFVEVKSGKSVKLSERETQVKACIEEKKVHFETIHHKGGQPVSPETEKVSKEAEETVEEKTTGAVSKPVDRCFECPYFEKKTEVIGYCTYHSITTSSNHPACKEMGRFEKFFLKY
jgi:predicted Holliday junction resolvase-like endonuclease